jgi:hypothetical protein
VIPQQFVSQTDQYQNYLIERPQVVAYLQDLRQLVPALALPSKTSWSRANIAKSMSGTTLATMGACERFHKWDRNDPHSGQCVTGTRAQRAQRIPVPLQRASAHEIVEVHETDHPLSFFKHWQRHHSVLLHNPGGDGSELVGLGGPWRSSHYIGDWHGQEIFFALHESGEIARGHDPEEDSAIIDNRHRSSLLCQ